MKKNLKYYVMIMPAMLISLCVILIPAILTVAASFTDWNGISLDMGFVGIDNYRELFANKVFRHALGNNFRWLFMFLTIPVIVALLASFLMVRNTRLRSIYQALFLFPYILAPMVNSILWLNVIYSPLSGVLGILKKLGISVSSPLGNPKTALFGVAAVDMWHYWGFLAVVFLASLRQTPMDQVEAATVDGASDYQLFRHIYFPSMMPTFRLMMIMIVINSMLSFNYVYMLTGGGPAQSTELLGTLSYKYAFSMYQFGKGAAIAVVMSTFGIAASILYTRMSKEE